MWKSQPIGTVQQLTVIPDDYVTLNSPSASNTLFWFVERVAVPLRLPVFVDGHRCPTSLPVGTRVTSVMVLNAMPTSGPSWVKITMPSTILGVINSKCSCFVQP